MSARLMNSNTVPQQKSSIIVVVRDLNDTNEKQLVLKQDPADETSNQYEDDESESAEQFEEHITYLDSKDDETESGLVWSRNRSSDFDSNATEYFLQIRGSEKYRNLFATKKFGRSKLWAEIAQEMNNAGYYVGEGKEAAERCRQKFSNLEKAVLNYMKHMSIPGAKKRDPPQFYELMANLVDYESKLYRNTQNMSITEPIRDKLELEMMTPGEKDSGYMPDGADTGHISDSALGSHRNGFSKMQSQKNEIMALLVKQHAELMKLQREYLEKLDKHLQVQSEQRERMINCFVEAMKEEPCQCKGKKRTAAAMESD